MTDETSADRPLNIGILTWEYPPSTSGLPRAAREIGQALAGAGHDVRVLTLDRAGVEHDGPVAVHGLAAEMGAARAYLRQWATIGHLAAPLTFRSAVGRLHADEPFDVVEATNWHAPAASIGTGRWRASPPFVTRCSTPAGIGWEARTGWRERMDGRAVDRFERRQAHRSAGLISNTAAHRERIRASYGLGGEGDSDADGTPHHALPPPVDPALVARGAAAPHPDVGDATSEPIVSGGAPVPSGTAPVPSGGAPVPSGGAPVRFLFVGRSDRRKGFDAIADAVRAAPPEPGWRIDMVGTGPADLTGEYADLAGHPLITAYGRVDDDALHALMVRAHAVLAPSRSESFGYVYQEAMAYGRPVVALAMDASAREFVGEPGAGLLAEADTGAAVGAAMARLVGDRDLRLVLRERALMAAGRCTPEACAVGTVALYRAAMGC